MQKILISRLQGSITGFIQNVLNGLNTGISVTRGNTGNINFAVKVDNSTIKINGSDELYAITTSVWSTLTALTAYAMTNASAYPGQLLTCSENNLNTVYVINNDLSVTLINSETVIYPSLQTDDTILKGQPLYIKNNGHIGLAKADNFLTSKVIGFAINDTSIGFACEYTGDLVSLTDWTTIAGVSTLTFNNYYYLSPSTAGTITSIAPSTIGQYVCQIGEALSTTELLIAVRSTVLL